MNALKPGEARAIFEVALPEYPYPGLRPFEKHEWPVFFGREKMTDATIERLIRDHVVCIHGDSGSGKSSIVRAGVLPRLEQDHARGGVRWATATMLPRNAPLVNLARAFAELDGKPEDAGRIDDFLRTLYLGRKAAPALAKMLKQRTRAYRCVLADQFEELIEFGRAGGATEAQVFSEVLVGIVEAPPEELFAMLTMRSEYLGELAHYPGFAEAVNRTQYLLPRMDRPALVRAIRDPAIPYGGSVSMDLANRLIADAGFGQDQLPLVQHGLMLLYHREPKTGSGAWELTIEDYKEAGNLAALLSGHADEVAAQAVRGADGNPDPRREDILEKTFRALVSVNADGKAIQRPRTVAQLMEVTGADLETMRAIVDPFRAEGVTFLRPFGAKPLALTDQISISHESLIRCWDRISRPVTGWLAAESRDGNIWKSLLLQAESADNILPPGLTEERSRWIEGKTANWSERYGGGWDRVTALLEASRKARESSRQRDFEMALNRRELSQKQGLLKKFAAALVLLALGFGALLYRSYELSIESSRLEGESDRLQVESDRFRNKEVFRIATLAQTQVFNGDAASGLRLAQRALDLGQAQGRAKVKVESALFNALGSLRERSETGLAERARLFATSADKRYILGVGVRRVNTRKLFVLDLADKKKICEKSMESSHRQPEILFTRTGSLVWLYDKTTAKITILNVKQCTLETISVESSMIDNLEFRRISTNGEYIVVAKFAEDTENNELVQRFTNVYLLDARTAQIVHVPGLISGDVIDIHFSFNDSYIVIKTNQKKILYVKIFDGTVDWSYDIRESSNEYLSTYSNVLILEKLKRDNNEKEYTFIDFSTNSGGVHIKTLNSQSSFVGYCDNQKNFFIYNGSIDIFSIKPLTNIATIEIPNSPVGGAIVSSFDCSNSDNSMFVTFDNGTVVLFDLSVGVIAAIFNRRNYVPSYSWFNDDKGFLTTISPAMLIVEWLRETNIKQFAPNHLNWSNTLFSPDGETIMVESEQTQESKSMRMLSLWRSKEKEFMKHLVQISLETILPSQSVVAEYSNDSENIYTYVGDGAGTLIGISEKGVDVALRSSGARWPVVDAGFIQNDTVVVVAATDGRLGFWDARTGEPAGSVLQFSELMAMKVSADGTRIALKFDSSSTEAQPGTAPPFLGIKVLDAITRKEIWSLPAAESAFRDFSLSHDGSQVLTIAGDDGAVQLWAFGEQSGRKLWNEDPAATSIAFDRGGRRFATGHADGTIRVWDSAQAQPVLELGKHTGEVLKLSFSNNGRLFSDASRSVVQIWPAPMSIEALRKAAREAKTRCLTAAQLKEIYLDVSDEAPEPAGSECVDTEK